MSFDVYSTIPHTHKIGRVHSNGEVVDLNGGNVGKIFNDGKIKSRDGENVGVATREGNFIGELTDHGYKMDLKGNIYLNNQCIGLIKQIDKGMPKELAQWAACALLLAPLQKPQDKGPAETLIASPEKIKEMIKEAKIAAFKRDQELHTIKKKSPFR